MITLGQAWWLIIIEIVMGMDSDNPFNNVAKRFDCDETQTMQLHSPQRCGKWGY